MKKLAIALILALAATTLDAQSLNGSWNLVSTGTPHGDMHYQVTFASGEGSALRADLTLFGSTVAMTGEVKDGTFRVSGDGHGSTLTLSGKIKSDGTLEGFLSSEQGDLTFTGTRAK